MKLMTMRLRVTGGAQRVQAEEEVDIRRRRGDDDTITYSEALGHIRSRAASSHKDNYSSSLRRCYGGSKKSPTGLYPARLFSMRYEDSSSEGHSVSLRISRGLLDALVAVDSQVTELFFDAEELVVLSHTVGTAERTGLDLTRVRSYSDVSDRSIFRLTRAV